MARERDGWEYTKDGPRWAPTVEIQMAAILGGLYGQEYEDAREELEDLVRAANRESEEKLRAWAKKISAAAGPIGASISVCINKGADMIAPNYRKEPDSE
ncbi:hypothetical protein [Streptomyces sp. BBFR102]|uniref:hypothetical protein n=1 Tax=Streptomyces sp. BBFR102 TaxID=3448171 RepID=UPI003F536757